MTRARDPYAAFRINLEQQRKRAKDLVRARRRAHADGFKLADAQFLVARDLGFASWRELREHITAMRSARTAMERTTGSAPDKDLRTLHIRCGSDIQHELVAAGFRGDFLSLWDWLPVGPVTNGPDWLERRARFHASAGVGPDGGSAAMLAELAEADRRLTCSAQDYDRVVLWMEHDSHDQLALVRCLAQYGRTGAPRVLDLISIDRFPGSRPFVGLGQLPPEAMRLLWHRRTTIGAAQIDVASAAWNGLTADDPRSLAALMRSSTPVLPHLAPALHRHLRELPSRENGLSLTQRLILEVLSERSATLGDAWRLYNEREPLPFLADTMFVHYLDAMARASTPLIERTRVDAEHPFRDVVTMTAAGRSVLRGEGDWLSVDPPTRWVGGVELRSGQPNWRWDEERHDVVSI